MRELIKKFFFAVLIRRVAGEISSARKLIIFFALAAGFLLFFVVYARRRFRSCNKCYQRRSRSSDLLECSQLAELRLSLFLFWLFFARARHRQHTREQIASGELESRMTRRPTFRSLCARHRRGAIVSALASLRSLAPTPFVVVVAAWRLDESSRRVAGARASVSITLASRRRHHLQKFSPSATCDFF